MHIAQKIRLVVLDWAGTTVDFGCSPVASFARPSRTRRDPDRRTGPRTDGRGQDRPPSRPARDPRAFRAMAAPARPKLEESDVELTIARITSRSSSKRSASTIDWSRGCSLWSKPCESEVSSWRPPPAISRRPRISCSTRRHVKGMIATSTSCLIWSSEPVDRPPDDLSRDGDLGCLSRVERGQGRRHADRYRRRAERGGLERRRDRQQQRGRALG